MLKEIQGLHHVTSMASDAQTNNDFFTKVLGLRRVKKTVNFDAPDVYHLYYGDEVGTPGTVMTYFPFPNIPNGARGAGEVGVTNFSVLKGSLNFWQDHLAELKVSGLSKASRFGDDRLLFNGPDGDAFSLVEVEEDARAPWSGTDIPEDVAIRGFHSTTLRIRDAGASSELLKFMNYEKVEETADGIKMAVNDGNEANVIELETLPGAKLATQGAGSVHHIAFAVEDRAAQQNVRKALLDTGYAVTPVIDRDYFWAIYFRTPDGILFEVATNEPGFDRDEDTAQLGQNLKLPSQHEHLRSRLEDTLKPIID